MNKVTNVFAKKTRKPRKSKYPFDSLRVGGKPWKYDPKAGRAVQTAVAQYNKKHRESGDGVWLISRQGAVMRIR